MTDPTLDIALADRTRWRHAGVDDIVTLTVPRQDLHALASELAARGMVLPASMRVPTLAVAFAAALDGASPFAGAKVPKGGREWSPAHWAVMGITTHLRALFGEVDVAMDPDTQELVGVRVHGHDVDMSAILAAARAVMEHTPAEATIPEVFSAWLRGVVLLFRPIWEVAGVTEAQMMAVFGAGQDAGPVPVVPESDPAVNFTDGAYVPTCVEVQTDHGAAPA